MEKRFHLFIFLSLAILTVYQSLVVKPVPKPVPGATVASGATGTRSSTTSTTAPAAVAPIPQPTEQAAPPPPSADVPALVGETSEREVSVESPVDLRFEFRSSGGIAAVKEFHLQPASYVLTITTTISDGDKSLAPALVWGPAVGDVSEVSRYTQSPEAILFAGGKVQRVVASKIAAQPKYDGDFPL